MSRFLSGDNPSNPVVASDSEFRFSAALFIFDEGTLSLVLSKNVCAMLVYQLSASFFAFFLTDFSDTFAASSFRKALIFLSLCSRDSFLSLALNILVADLFSNRLT